MVRVYREVEQPARLRPVREQEERWVAETFLPWNEGRRRVIAEALAVRRQSTEPLPAVVAAALLGRLLEHTASELKVPQLSAEATEAIRAPVRDLEQRALRAYESCHEGALAAGSVVDGWRRYCGRGLSRFGR